MKSYHKLLYELTQAPDWQYTDHIKLTKNEVMGLIEEYQKLKDKVREVV